MVSVNEAFPSKYLKSADLQGAEVPVVIASAQIEEVGQQKDRKLVMYFRGKQKGMIVNKTNADRIAFSYGDDTEGWVGKQIILYAEMTTFGGNKQLGLRVRVPAPPRQMDPQFHAARQQVQQHLNGGAPVQQQYTERNSPPPTTAHRVDDLDDSVPF